MPGVLDKLFGLEFNEHKRAKIGSDAEDSVQVIGAGLPRSGTTSLKAALEILGFDPCHHMIDCVQSVDQCRMFTEAIRTQSNDPSCKDSTRLALIRKAVRGYRATVDSPTCDVYRELMTIFPSAKVVLNLRDSPDAWWHSFSNTLALQLRWHYYVLTLPVPFLREQRKLSWEIFGRRERQGILGPQWYQTHMKEVRENVPKERLLEFNVKEGWGPLCEFLEVPVPDQPFPHLNDTKALQNAIKGAQLYGASVWLLYFGLAGAAAWLALRPPTFVRDMVASYRPF